MDSSRAESERDPGVDTPEPRSRRSFIFFGALAAASLVPKGARAQGTKKTKVLQTADVGPEQFPTVTSPEANLAPGEWASDVVRLVRRVTNGVTAADVTLAKSLGYHGYLNYQLNYKQIDDSSVDAFVTSKWPQLAYTGDQLFSMGENSYIALQEATVYRAAFSRRQLYERMVEFWSDHLNIDAGKVSYLKIIDDREVIRKNALGKFGDLIKASSKSAAMLSYLDQNLSRVGSPNQNYARELLELHTLGVDNGYTQDDVAELSRVLTGWTFTGRGGAFNFNTTLHDYGSKVVMGTTVPAGSSNGLAEGENLIDMLVNHPNTALFIAEKMLKWLLTPEPTQTQITTIASVFKATKGDIKSMVRAILNDQWLPAAPVKFKRPFHYLVSSLRSTAPGVASITSTNQQLIPIGQPLFLWETPDGYPDKLEYWAGNILPRWSLANTIANSASTTTINVDVSVYLGGTQDAAIDRIDQNFFGSEMPAATRLALLNYLKGGTFNTTRVRETISLALSSAAFQWY